MVSLRLDARMAAENLIDKRICHLSMHRVSPGKHVLDARYFRAEDLVTLADAGKTFPGIAYGKTAVALGASNSTGRGAISKFTSHTSISPTKPGNCQQAQLGTEKTPAVVHIQPLMTAALTRSSQAATHIVHSPPIESPITPIRFASTFFCAERMSMHRIKSQSVDAA